MSVVSWDDVPKQLASDRASAQAIVFCSDADKNASLADALIANGIAVVLPGLETALGSSIRSTKYRFVSRQDITEQ
jgi:hypothetical protein